MRKSYQLMGILLISSLCFGCSCSSDKYKFYSYTSGGKTYKCSSSDKKDSSVKAMCDSFEDFSIVLKSNDKAVIDMPYYNMNDMETNYKIEDSSLYIRDDDEVEFNRLGSYSDNEIKVTMGSVTITLKK